MKIITEYSRETGRYKCTCGSTSVRYGFYVSVPCKHSEELASENKKIRYYNYYLYIFFFFIIGGPIGILIEDYNTQAALSVPLYLIAYLIIQKIKRPLVYVKEFDSD